MSVDPIRSYLDTISHLASGPMPVDESMFQQTPTVHPLIAAMKELQAEGIVETVSTGQGGGSAGGNGGQMVGGPTTYEQEYDMFKSKGPRRIMPMT